MDILSFIIGCVAASLLIGFVVFILDFFRKPGSSVVGTLYVHTSEEKDVYSFAFDFPLEEIKNRDIVMLNVKVKKAKSAVKIIDEMEELENEEEH